MQVSIAEQIATADPKSTLEAVQKHTENGHGLATLRDTDPVFPGNYYVHALQSGHFSSYCQSLDTDISAFSFAKRHRTWKKVTSEEKAKMVTLTDLLRRVPELRPAINECLCVPPLSFHIAHSDKNMILKAQRVQGAMLRTGHPGEPFWAPEAADGPTTETYLTFATGYGGGEGVTGDFLAGLGLPITDIVEETDGISGRKNFVGKYVHPSDKFWWDSLALYSAPNGTSLIVPLWGSSDPFLLHFVILYALSIIVRYLPSLWFQIEHGPLDHIKALIEEYIIATDNILPKLAIQRIAGIKLSVAHPGSLMAPT